MLSSSTDDHQEPMPTLNKKQLMMLTYDFAAPNKLSTVKLPSLSKCAYSGRYFPELQAWIFVISCNSCFSS
jgi:hypothetical protein